MSLLSKRAIQRCLESGEIIIDPFNPENLKSTQYDVTLGRYCYREVTSGSPVYNPFDERMVKRKWQLDEARRHRDLIDDNVLGELAGIGLDEEIILLKPGEMILGHTEEFIGGACNHITTMMKARSSVGRSFLEICRCAGMGDVGYFQRWTLEIANTSRDQMIPLVRGRRYGQILFFEVDPVAAADMYGATGKYQEGASLERIKAAWSPEQMLPKQWLDREAVAQKKPGALPAR